MHRKSPLNLTLLALTAALSVSADAQPAADPHTLAQYPQFTPEEMGKRTLALIDSLKSVDELSLERIQKVTGFPMKHIRSGHSDVFSLDLSKSNWIYGFNYSEDSATKRGWASLYFTDPANPDNHDSGPFTDMTPVCLDYNTYVSQLEQMGFREKTSNHRDFTYSRYYVRGNVRLQLMSWQETHQPGARQEHSCLLYLGIS
jgi:hypothetical protein